MLAPWKESCHKLSVLKSRDITLLIMVCTVKAMIFPVVVYGCESWIIKRAKHRRMTLSNCGAGEDSWESRGQHRGQTSPKGNQPWIFIGRTDAEAEAPVLWPPDVKSWSLEKTLMLVKIEGKRRKRWQRMRWLDSITDSVDMDFSKLWEIVEDREAWRAIVHGVSKNRHDLVTE